MYSDPLSPKSLLTMKVSPGNIQEILMKNVYKTLSMSGASSHMNVKWIDNILIGWNQSIGSVICIREMNVQGGSVIWTQLILLLVIPPCPHLTAYLRSVRFLLIN